MARQSTHNRADGILKYMDTDGKIYCQLCWGYVGSSPIGECGVSGACTCRYLDGPISLIILSNGYKFNNTKHLIIASDSSACIAKAKGISCNASCKECKVTTRQKEVGSIN